MSEQDMAMRGELDGNRSSRPSEPPFSFEERVIDNYIAVLDKHNDKFKLPHKVVDDEENRLSSLRSRALGFVAEGNKEEDFPEYELLIKEEKKDEARGPKLTQRDISNSSELLARLLGKINRHIVNISVLEQNTHRGGYDSHIENEAEEAIRLARKLPPIPLNKKGLDNPFVRALVEMRSLYTDRQDDALKAAIPSYASESIHKKKNIRTGLESGLVYADIGIPGLDRRILVLSVAKEVLISGSANSVDNINTRLSQIFSSTEDPQKSETFEAVLGLVESCISRQVLNPKKNGPNGTKIDIPLDDLKLDNEDIYYTRVALEEEKKLLLQIRDNPTSVSIENIDSKINYLQAQKMGRALVHLNFAISGLRSFVEKADDRALDKLGASYGRLSPEVKEANPDQLIFYRALEFLHQNCIEPEKPGERLDPNNQITQRKVFTYLYGYDLGRHGIAYEIARNQRNMTDDFPPNIDSSRNGDFMGSTAIIPMLSKYVIAFSHGLYKKDNGTFTLDRIKADKFFNSPNSLAFTQYFIDPAKSLFSDIMRRNYLNRWDPRHPDSRYKVAMPYIGWVLGSTIGATACFLTGGLPLAIFGLAMSTAGLGMYELSIVSKSRARQAEADLAHNRNSGIKTKFLELKKTLYNFSATTKGKTTLILGGAGLATGLIGLTALTAGVLPALVLTGASVASLVGYGVGLNKIARDTNQASKTEQKENKRSFGIGKIFKFLGITALCLGVGAGVGAVATGLFGGAAALGAFWGAAAAGTFTLIGYTNTAAKNLTKSKIVGGVLAITEGAAAILGFGAWGLGALQHKARSVPVLNQSSEISGPATGTEKFYHTVNGTVSAINNALTGEPKKQSDADKPSVKPAPVDTSVKPAPVGTSVKPAPVDTSVKPAPVDTSVKPAPVDTSVKPAPVDTSVKPAPVDTSVKPAPSASTNQTAVERYASTKLKTPPSTESRTSWTKDLTADRIKPEVIDAAESTTRHLG